MAADLKLPPGFRFHPTDEELVLQYLCRKCASQSIAVPIIAEIDLYKFDPWDLPGLSLYGEKEWYFFSPRERKYPNGSRPNRAAGAGYWKATGADKPIGKPKPVGIKKALVFYSGKAPKGEKTNWIMHEYRLADVDRSAREKSSSRLDDWVLCRIYNKKGNIEKRPQGRSRKTEPTEIEDQKPAVLKGGATLPRSLVPAPPPSITANGFKYFDPSDSIPKLRADSSCSERVVSHEFASEVQSEPRWTGWDNKNEQTFLFDYMDTTLGNDVASQFQGGNQISPLQDIFTCLQKPFGILDDDAAARK